MSIGNYDVVIRCRDEIAWLGKTIKSLHTQTCPPQKIIVVDDASSDGSRELAVDLGCVVIDYNLDAFNYSAALNLGLERVDSDFALILSAHCPVVSCNGINYLLSEFSDSDVAGVFGRQIPTKNSKNVDIRDLLTVFGRQRIVYDLAPFFHNAFSMIRRSDWEAVKFNESVNGIEDRFWACDIVKGGRKIIYVPDAVVIHEHGLNHGSDEGRAERVVQQIRMLHQDDALGYPGEEWRYLLDIDSV